MSKAFFASSTHRSDVCQTNLTFAKKKPKRDYMNWIVFLFVFLVWKKKLWFSWEFDEQQRPKPFTWTITAVKLMIKILYTFNNKKVIHFFPISSVLWGLFFTFNNNTKISTQFIKYSIDLIKVNTYLMRVFHEHCQVSN